MRLSEAFAILELAETADEAAVKEAYRRLSAKKHPDRTGGNSDEQASLNEAYSVALATFRPSGELVLRTARSVERVEAALFADRAARQSEQMLRSISKRRKRPLVRLRDTTFVVALSAGALLLFADYLAESVLASLLATDDPLLTLSLSMLAVTFGIFALWMQTRVQQIESSIRRRPTICLDHGIVPPS